MKPVLLSFDDPAPSPARAIALALVGRAGGWAWRTGSILALLGAATLLTGAAMRAYALHSALAQLAAGPPGTASAPPWHPASAPSGMARSGGQAPGMPAARDPADGPGRSSPRAAPGDGAEAVDRMAGWLNRPWPHVFDLVEDPSTPQVRLVSVEARFDTGAPVLRVQAEGMRLDDLLAHVGRYPGNARVDHVVLLGHESHADDPSARARVTFEIVLREAAP